MPDFMRLSANLVQDFVVYPAKINSTLDAAKHGGIDMSASHFTYSISQEVLSGTIDGKPFRARAVAGGRRGNKSGVHLSDLAYWSPSTKLPETSSSVGKGAANKATDVKTVQALLNKNGAALKIDGDIGPKTIAAISGFQKRSGFSKPDGRVDKNGKTWKLLIREVAGGPLPPGKYTMSWDPKKFSKGCIRLNLQQLTEMFPGSEHFSTVTAWKLRNGMLIHGRGKRGSDGCIVPVDSRDLHQINKFVQNQKTSPVLTVVDPYIPARIVEKIETLRHTA